MPLRLWARQLGFTVVGEYVDRASGGNPNRPEFKRLFLDASQDKFDVVLVWALDRFSREPTEDVLRYIRQLRGNNIGLMSEQEKWLDTRSENPTSELLLLLFSWVAKQERLKISDRTKAAHARLKAIGMSTGHRPANIIGSGESKTLLDPIQVKQFYRNGHSYEEIAKHYHCSLTPIKRIVNEGVAKGELVKRGRGNGLGTYGQGIR